MVVHTSNHTWGGLPKKLTIRYLDRYPPCQIRQNEPITDLSSSPPQESGEVVGVSTKIFTDHSKLLLGQNYWSRIERLRCPTDFEIWELANNNGITMVSSGFLFFTDQFILFRCLSWVFIILTWISMDSAYSQHSLSTLIGIFWVSPKNPRQNYENPTQTSKKYKLVRKK